MRPPEIAWADLTPEATPRQRSLALGKAVHSVFESWYTPGAQPDWHDLPGRVALSGAHYLPHPRGVMRARVEQPIGRVPCDAAPGGVVLEACGVRWAGFVDMWAALHLHEHERLGTDARVLIDYKSTASVSRYALSVGDLTRDLQANLYARDACERRQVDEQWCRWVYFETKRRRYAEPRDFTLAHAATTTVIEPAAEIARELDTIKSVDGAPVNPDACGDYGGCPYHHTAGGPCSARRSLGKLLARAPKQEERKMALDPEVKARFDAMKNKSTTPEVPLDATPEPEPPKRGRPRKAPADTERAPAPASAGDDPLFALVDELRAAREAYAAAGARVADVLHRIHKASASA